MDSKHCSTPVDKCTYCMYPFCHCHAYSAVIFLCIGSRVSIFTKKAKTNEGNTNGKKDDISIRTDSQLESNNLSTDDGCSS